MAHKYPDRPYRLLQITGIILTILLGLTILPAHSQSVSLIVTQAAEYDIGFDCPAAATLDPAGEIFWALMHNCGSGGYSLRGFNVADGSPVNDETDDFADALAVLDNTYFYHDYNPLGFLADGTLDIRYNDPDSYDMLNLRLDLASGAAEQPSSEDFNTWVRRLTEYPEITVYNADHTMAVAIGETTLHILDLQAETELFQIEAEGEAYGYVPSFSPDGASLYVGKFNNPEDMDDYSSTLSVYSLPGGDLLSTYNVPSALIRISPDGKFGAASIGDSQGNGDHLVMVELESGATSEPIPMFEPPAPVTTCLNSGNDVSDVDFTARGLLPLSGLSWLPDSSGFVTAHTYLGDAAGGGSLCIFNYSRMRLYTVESNA
jgi:hypothetical protein